MRYIGMDTDESQDFWVNIRTQNIFPVGHAKQNGFEYQAPNYVAHSLAEQANLLKKYLPNSKTISSDFYSLFQQEVIADLKVGQKLEVVDKTRYSTFRVASVDEIVGGRVHVKYDGEPADDPGFWAHPNSGFIRPVGWSQLVGHQLYASKEYAHKSVQVAFDKFKQRCNSDLASNITDHKNAREHDKWFASQIKCLGVLNELEFHDANANFKKGTVLFDVCGILLFDPITSRNET